MADLPGGPQQNRVTDAMHIRDFLAVLRARWIFITALTAVCIALAAGVSFSAVPVYRATAHVYFSLPYGNSAGDLSQGSTFTQSQVLTYAEMATMPIVLNPTGAELGVSAAALQGKVTAAATPDTVIVSVTASDTSPRRAARIANLVAQNLGQAAQQLSPKDTSGQPSVDSRTVGAAKVPSAPASPKKKRNLLLALLGGLFLGVAISFLYELVDTRIRSRADVEALLGLPVLGEIQTDRTLAREHVVMVEHPTGVQAEAFRRVDTNLTFLGLPSPLQLVVTSALPQEGKSSIAANLAIASAEGGSRTLLVDADLRSPSVSNYTGLEGAVGLANVLIGQVAFSDVVQPYGVEGRLDVLTAGPQPPNPGRLLGSDAMKELLRLVADSYDVVILDCAPLLAVTDAAVLARVVSGAVVVTRVAPSGVWRRRRGPRTPSRAQLMEAVGSLRQIDAEILGVVVNGLPKKSEAYYGYGRPSSGLDELPTTSPALISADTTEPAAHANAVNVEQPFVAAHAGSADEADETGHSDDAVDSIRSENSSDAADPTSVSSSGDTVVSAGGRKPSDTTGSPDADTTEAPDAETLEKGTSAPKHAKAARRKTLEQAEVGTRANEGGAGIAEEGSDGTEAGSEQNSPPPVADAAPAESDSSRTTPPPNARRSGGAGSRRSRVRTRNDRRSQTFGGNGGAASGSADSDDQQTENAVGRPR